MRADFLLLMLAAITESIWNIVLKKSTGLSDWKMNSIGATLVLIGIVAFKKALNTMPLSIAIVIWSGASILITIALDTYLFKTKIDYKMAVLMLICISSMLGLNYLAK